MVKLRPLATVILVPVRPDVTKEMLPVVVLVVVNPPVKVNVPA